MEWSYTDNRKQITIAPPKRTKKITGHRFSSVLGLNKYQTPFGAWCEITGLVRLPFEDNKFTIAGKIIEPKQIDYVREKFPNIKSCEEYYGNNFKEYQYSNFKDLGLIFDGVRDFVSTKNDGLTIAMVGECKTSSKPQDWENNNVPIDYLCQGMLYSYLDKLDKILYVTSFLQPMDYNDPTKYVVSEENTKLTVKKLNDCYLPLPTGEYGTIELAIEYCEEWWEKHVDGGISPEFDEVLDKEYLDIIRKSKPSNDTTLDALCLEGVNLAKRIADLKVSSGLSALEKDLKLIEASIKQTLLDKNLDGCGKYKLSRKTDMVFDENTFAKEHTNVYNKYCIEKVSYKLSKDLKEEDE